MSDRTTQKPFVISVSSRALFDLEESHQVFERDGQEAFERYQLDRIDEPLGPGPAYPLVKKLLDLNATLPADVPQFEVVILSRNSPETGSRVLSSIERLGLPIERMVFTNGQSPSAYAPAARASLFLSSNPAEVEKAMAKGIAAATLYQSGRSADWLDQRADDPAIRIAFDGDAVLFSDESEQVHFNHGLEVFHAHEKKNEQVPMRDGPLRAFLEAIHRIQEAFPPKTCPVRTALVTARSGLAGKRAINTLRSWGIRVDESFFLAGDAKGPYLKAFHADLFFDDSTHNVVNAADYVSSCHVPHGIRNKAGVDPTRFTGGQDHALPPQPSSAPANQDALPARPQPSASAPATTSKPPRARRSP